MLELLGLAVVTVIVVVTIRAFSKSKTKINFLQVRDKAVAAGVPLDFARQIVEQPELLEQAHSTIANDDKEVASLDMHDQYALAIAALYQTTVTSEYTSSANAVFLPDGVQSKLKEILEPQIYFLNEQEIPIQANIPTFVYVMTLAVALTPPPQSVSTEQVRIFLRNLLPGDEYGFNIDNAGSVLGDASNLTDMIEYLRDEAQSDIDTEVGDYLVRVSKKGDPADFIGKDKDQSSSSPLSFLDA